MSKEYTDKEMHWGHSCHIWMYLKMRLMQLKELNEKADNKRNIEKSIRIPHNDIKLQNTRL